MNKVIFGKLFLLTTFFSAWAGLIIILVASARKPEVEVNGLFIANFFSYFTTQSNILVGLVSGYFLLAKRTFKPLEQTVVLGTLLDITITFIIYQTVLAKIWDPEGLEFLGDFMIHTLTPILFVVYWLIFQTKKIMNFKLAIYWLVYPVVYLFYTLIRGAIVNWYPYPFVDASKLSTLELSVNALGVTVLFLIGAVVFVAINNSSLEDRRT